MTTTYAQLDRDTRDYLSSVKLRKGQGAPGIFIAGGTNPWPVLGCLVGGMMILATIGMMFTLPKSAWAVAMLVTAGLWLGGWLVAYPFRRWLGNRLGTFTYFDPHTVYQVNADEVTLTDISDMTGLEIVHNTSSNTYTSSTLQFRLPGRSLKVTVKSKTGADKVDVYYQALGEIESNPRWSTKSPGEQGAVAVYAVDHDSYPEDMKLAEYAVEMPETEAVVGKASGGSGLRYLAVLALGAAIFAGVWQMLRPLQDHEAYRNAQKHGVQGYRDYLLDDRNQLHRDEARQQIQELYKPLMDRVNTQATVPEYKTGLTGILKNLSASEGLPVVSIRVTEEPGAVPNFALLKDSREKAVRTDLADAFGTHFGTAFITFVECPADANPHFDVTYKVLDGGMLQWQLKLRDTPDAEAIAGPTRLFRPDASMSLADCLKAAIFKDVFGIVPPAVNNLPIGGGDFDE